MLSKFSNKQSSILSQRIARKSAPVQTGIKAPRIKHLKIGRVSQIYYRTQDIINVAQTTKPTQPISQIMRNGSKILGWFDKISNLRNQLALPIHNVSVIASRLSANRIITTEQKVRLQTKPNVLAISAALQAIYNQAQDSNPLVSRVVKRAKTLIQQFQSSNNSSYQQLMTLIEEEANNSVVDVRAHVFVLASLYAKMSMQLDYCLSTLSRQLDTNLSEQVNRQKQVMLLDSAKDEQNIIKKHYNLTFNFRIGTESQESQSQSQKPIQNQSKNVMDV